MSTFTFARRLFVCSLLSTLVGCGDPTCSLTEVQGRLDAAAAGEVVDITGCSLTGRLSVPPGVILRGERATTSIAGGIDVRPGTLATPSTVAGLRVTSDGGVAVRVAGDGHFALSDLAVTLERGVGIGVRGASEGRLSTIAVQGGVDAALSATLAPGAGITEGSYGLVCLGTDVASTRITLQDVSVVEAGPWGTLVESATLAWDGGSVAQITGIGVQVIDGELTLEDVVIEDMRQGAQVIPAYGVVSVNASTLLRRAELDRGEGLGVLSDGSELTVEGSSIVAQSLGGLFLQNLGNAQINTTMFDGNGFVGVASVGLVNTTVADCVFRGTALRRAVGGELMPIEVGDGLHVLEPEGVLSVNATSFLDNARVGVFIDVATESRLDASMLSGVIADATGDAIGALAQVGGAPIASGGWDVGIERRNAAIANDPVAAMGPALDVTAPLGAGGLPMPVPDLVSE